MQSTISEAYKSSTIEVSTPIGNLFATFIDDSQDNCNRVIIQIGKSGTNTRAWSEAVGSLINRMLDMNINLVSIADSLSAYSSDGNTHNNSRSVRSGPDGIVYAIHSYMDSKKKSDNNGILNMRWLN